VGCGEVVQVIHLPTLALLPDQFTVTALCDVSAAVLRGVGDQWGVAARFTDYRDLLRSADVDAILVTNPHAYHAEVVQAACAAGKHVFVEKPMCLTLIEADAIIAAQEHTGVTVQVGYMRRYAPAFIEACRLVREMETIQLARVHDVIGRNALIIGQVARVIRGADMPADLIAVGQALQAERVREAIGDAPPDVQSAYMLLLGLSSHDISAMRELLGMPERVLYAAQRHAGRYLTAAFDYGAYVCHFETGVDTIPRSDTYMAVYGPARTVHLRYETPYVRNLPIRLTITEPDGAGGVRERIVQPTWEDAFHVEWRAFHHNITTGTTPKTTPTDARQDLALFGEMARLMQRHSV